jgi:hypothetical protein
VTDDRERKRVSFDEDPNAYDRSRPVAPAHVFDDVVAPEGVSSTVRCLSVAKSRS